VAVTASCGAETAEKYDGTLKGLANAVSKDECCLLARSDAGSVGFSFNTADGSCLWFGTITSSIATAGFLSAPIVSTRVVEHNTTATNANVVKHSLRAKLAALIVPVPPMPNACQTVESDVQFNGTPKSTYFSVADTTECCSDCLNDPLNKCVGYTYDSTNAICYLYCKYTGETSASLFYSANNTGRTPCA